jgi:ribosomal protein S18 acetylase RimI-like enzyme
VALAVIEADGIDALVLDELVEADVETFHWAGGVPHVASIRDQLVRMAVDDVDYLVVRAPDGTPVAKAGIDYAALEEAGVIWQVAVHDRLQRRGLGTRLIAASERLIRARGLPTAALSVELDNPRARALYERLGYVAERDRETGWLAEDPDGVVGWHSTTVTDLWKPL